MKNHTFTGIGILVLMFSVSGFAYTGGNGTSSNPYQIADANDLLELAADTANYDKYFILTANINMAGHSFTTAVIAPDTSDSAGYQGTKFTGCFDGNYHIISNLIIDTQGQGKDHLGLFGWILNINGEGAVKQLGLDNVSLTSGNNSESIGTLAGMNESLITSCYARGSMTVGSDVHTVGGLIGGSGSQISNCYADVDIYTGAYVADIGGFAGKAYGPFGYCYASGYVQGTAPVVGGFGGSTLYGNWFIIKCYYLTPADGGGPNNSVATVLTDAQMRLQSSFFTWDFQGSAADGENEIWQMNGYPALNWQVPVGMRQLAVLSRYWNMTGCTSGQPCAIADWYDDDAINITDLEFLIESWLGCGMKTDYPKTADDFETGDFTTLPWVHSGNANWTVISGTDVYNGTYSAKSGAIGNSQSSSLELTANITGDSEIVFAVKISSESGFDGLTFYIDGNARLMNYSGQHDWTEISLSGFGTGTHTFKWSYSKDSSSIAGSDCVWLDNIRILRLEQ
jgi:hypothetical protein